MPDLIFIADNLFQEKSFAASSLSEIAEIAALPLSELEREFPCKEDFCLAIYQQIAQESFEQAEKITTGQIAERYFNFMTERINLLSAHDESVTALFSYAMLPKSHISPATISPGLRDPMMKAMQQLVRQADDAPRDKSDNDNLAMLLYSFHFLVLIFWLYDRTQAKQATYLFINFLREFVKLTRPMMIMPLMSKALTKMSQIVMLVFGGARLIENEDKA